MLMICLLAFAKRLVSMTFFLGYTVMMAEFSCTAYRVFRCHNQSEVTFSAAYNLS